MTVDIKKAMIASVIFIMVATAGGIFVAESARITGVSPVPDYANITGFDTSIYTTTEGMGEPVPQAQTTPNLDIWTVSIGGIIWVLNTPFILSGLITSTINSIGGQFGNIGYVGIALFGILTIIALFYVYETIWGKR